MGEAAGVQHTLKNSEKRISTAEVKKAVDHVRPECKHAVSGGERQNSQWFQGIIL